MIYRCTSQTFRESIKDTTGFKILPEGFFLGFPILQAQKENVAHSIKQSRWVRFSPIYSLHNQLTTNELKVPVLSIVINSFQWKWELCLPRVYNLRWNNYSREETKPQAEQLITVAHPPSRIGYTDKFKATTCPSNGWAKAHHRIRVPVAQVH